jgi:transcriptional regulator GlxA family with amidase domain
MLIKDRDVWSSAGPNGGAGRGVIRARRRVGSTLAHRSCRLLPLWRLSRPGKAQFGYALLYVFFHVAL